MQNNVLMDYIFDPRNPETNFNLAVKYYDIGQTASAISFFLRCADRSEEDYNLAYECLIHIGHCFDIQGNRHEHVRSLYRHAMSLLPRRPEAYYMLANFENWHKQYGMAYTITSTALEVCDFSQKPFKMKCKYPGIWGLIYERALSSFWHGKSQLTRDLYKSLKENYFGEMDDYHREKVKSEFDRLGSISQLPKTPVDIK